jgi:hypothetical protein
MASLNSALSGVNSRPAISALDQRRSPRVEVEVSAIMRVDGKPGPFLVTILDVSANGLRLSFSDPFPAGTRVKITYRNVDLMGEVRYARALDRHVCNIGVLIDMTTGGCETETGELDLTRLFSKRTARS